MTIKAYKTKAIISGGIYEFYHYEDLKFRGYQRKPSSGSPNTFFDSEGVEMRIDYETGEMIPKKLHSRGRSNIRAQNLVKRLANSNFDHRSKFITLTFDPKRYDVTEVDEGKHLFKKFIDKLRKWQKEKGKELKYIAVIEFHKSGRVHFHMLCNLNYINQNRLTEIWGYGITKINRIDHVDDVGAYIAKYMTKADADPRLYDKKMYQPSQNLEKPKELIGAQAEWLRQQMIIEGIKKVHSSSYEDKQTANTINYEKFNRQRSHALVKK